MRAALDVNVIISAILAPKGTPRQVLTSWQAGLFTHVTSEGIIAQVEEKLRDPETGGAYGVTAEDIRWIAVLLRTQAEIQVVPLTTVDRVTGDPEDDYVLATAECGNAQYLVTGDRALRALMQHRDVAIVNPRAFLDIVTASLT